ncbi:hypothetical protein MESS4_290027 [Mesorhizobium sp. STM 4661]|nr:hypothetical protein MESS4_290027 [Mesorhizobium sp. STM 4661]
MQERLLSLSILQESLRLPLLILDRYANQYYSLGLRVGS